MSTYEIYWDDLNSSAKKRLYDLKEGNNDISPLAVIELVTTVTELETNVVKETKLNKLEKLVDTHIKEIIHFCFNTVLESIRKNETIDDRWFAFGEYLDINMNTITTEDGTYVVFVIYLIEDGITQMDTFIKFIEVYIDKTKV